MKFILLGAPGAGKGTQAELLSRVYNIPKLSTGDILRDAINSGDSLGKKLESIMNEGHLVSDDIIISIVKARLAQADCVKGYILDGFPRTLTQAHALDAFLGDQKSSSLAVNFSVSEDLLVKRIVGRFNCVKCKASYHEEYHLPNVKGICDICGHDKFIHRKDDNEAVLKQRLQEYNDKTAILAKYYAEDKRLVNIDGSKEINAITEDVRNSINQYFNIA